MGVYRRTLKFVLYFFKHAVHARNRTARLYRGSLYPWPVDLTGGTGMDVGMPGHAPTAQNLSYPEKALEDCMLGRPLWCMGLSAPHHDGCTRLRGPD